MKKKIIKFLLSRFTDYYQIKEDNEKLKSNMYELLENPSSERSFIIIESHRIKKNINKIMWMGDVNPKPFEGLRSFDGIITHETI